MKSRIQKEKRCLVCGATQPLHEHHIFNSSNRSKAEADGLKIYLCAYCHQYTHLHKEQLNFFKKLGERYFLENIGSFEEYMHRYRVNYLDQEEIDECELNRIEGKKDAIR